MSANNAVDIFEMAKHFIRRTFINIKFSSLNFSITQARNVKHKIGHVFLGERTGNVYRVPEEWRLYRRENLVNC